MYDYQPNRRTLRLPLEGCQVLLVEDNDDSREVATILLEAEGATVNAVACVKEALASLDGSIPDVLVSDIGMPDRDGYDLIRAIRLRPPELGRNIPAIALTSLSSEKDRQATFDAGFEAHLCKPVEPAELVSIIKGLTG